MSARKTLLADPATKPKTAMIRSISFLATFIAGISAAAAGSVNFQNGESVLLYFTVIDQTPPAKGILLYDGILNASEQKPVGCNGDQSGKCHIVWETSTELPPPGSSDPYPKGCGSGDVSDLSDGASVTVTAKGTC